MIDAPTGDIVESDGEEFHRVQGLIDVWVSRYGRVYGRNSNSGFGVKRTHRKRGTKFVCVVMGNGFRTSRAVASIVWSTFMGDASRGWYAAPIDGDKENVALSNLELRSKKKGRRKENVGLTLDQWQSGEAATVAGNEYRPVPGRPGFWANEEGLVCTLGDQDSPTAPRLTRSMSVPHAVCIDPETRKQTVRRIARMVYSTFIDVPRVGDEVYVLDDNVQNTAVSNLAIRPKGWNRRGKKHKTSEWLKDRDGKEITIDGESFSPVPNESMLWVSRSGGIAGPCRGKAKVRRPAFKTVSQSLIIDFRYSGKRKWFSPMSLIWTTFKGEIPIGHCVKPIDGDFDNIAVENLHLKYYPARNPTKPNSTAKLKVQQVREVLASSASDGELATKYDVSNACIDKVRRGENYRYVKPPQVPPASESQRSYLRDVLRDLRVGKKLSDYIARRIDSSGQFMLSVSDVMAECRLSRKKISTELARCVDSGIMSRPSTHRFIASLPGDSHESIERFRLRWQDHMDSLIISPYQREILKLRIRRVVDMDDVINGVDVELTSDVSCDGVFRMRKTNRPGFSADEMGRIFNELEERWVISRISAREMRFNKMPPRHREAIDPKSVEQNEEQIEKRKKDAPIDHYAHAVEMLAEGRMLDEVRSITLIDAKTLYQLHRLLQETRVTRTLVLKCLPCKDLATLLRIPEPAARALSAYYAIECNSNIQAS